MHSHFPAKLTIRVGCGEARTASIANDAVITASYGLKEQAIHGRIFKNVEEVRAAVAAFRDRYNRHWRLEKLGFMSPLEARQAYAIRKAA